MLPGLTMTAVRQNTDPKVFERAQAYVRSRAVRQIIRRGEVLHAKVEGSTDRPYRVQVRFGQRRIEEATCTCPYNWGGWCKHIAAVLLVCLDHPEGIQPAPTLDELLGTLEPDQLRALLQALADRNAAVLTFIERWLVRNR